MIDYQAVRTHFFDAFFADAAAAGIRQVVILAAGLDSRAYRLGWPAGTVVYEIDLPKVLEYKADTLAAMVATPPPTGEPCPSICATIGRKRCATLVSRPTRPAAWLAEGLLPFLPAAAQEALFAAIDQLSGPGSRLAVEVFGVDPERRRDAEEKWAQFRANREARGLDSSFNPLDLWFDDEGRPGLPRLVRRTRLGRHAGAGARRGRAARAGVGPVSGRSVNALVRPFALNRSLTATKP